VSSTAVGQVGTEWQIESTNGDFNSDGTTDVLFQRNDGTIMEFAMHNNQLQTYQILNPHGNDWHIA
jgi:hypothetical protein